MRNSCNDNLASDILKRNQPMQVIFNTYDETSGSQEPKRQHISHAIPISASSSNSRDSLSNFDSPLVRATTGGISRTPLCET